MLVLKNAVQNIVHSIDGYTVDCYDLSSPKVTVPIFKIEYIKQINFNIVEFLVYNTKNQDKNK